MTGTSPAVAVGLVVRLLREGFEGAPGPWTYFTDASLGTGVPSTIDALTAAQASPVSLRRAYEDPVVAVRMRSTRDEDAIGTAFGAIAHTAYHLSAIRQRLMGR